MLTHSVQPELAHRFKSGEHDAFAKVYRQNRHALHAAAYALLRDVDLAAEAVQHAFVRAWRAAPTFDTSRDLRPWLYAIVRRAAVDVHRRARPSRGHLPLDEASVPATNSTGSLERAWLAGEVAAALRSLSREERDVVTLAYYSRLTQVEIGRSLGIPLGTVKSRMARAHGRLRHLLGHLRDADPQMR